MGAQGLVLRPPPLPDPPASPHGNGKQARGCTHLPTSPRGSGPGHSAFFTTAESEDTASRPVTPGAAGVCTCGCVSVDNGMRGRGEQVGGRPSAEPREKFLLPLCSRSQAVLNKPINQEAACHER